MVARLPSYTDQIIYFGPWQSVVKVDAALQEIETLKEQKEALKAQINFRKYVWKQSPSKNEPEYDRIILLRKTENNKIRDLTVEEFTANVKKLKNLVQHAFTITEKTDETEESIPMLVGKTVAHKFNEEVEAVWYKGIFISQVIQLLDLLALMGPDQANIIAV